MAAVDRRTAIRAFAAASAGPFFAFPATRRANLLFLCSDQHQAAAAGCYGHATVRTPHIDAIAEEGVRFESAYCQAPACVPSRGSIITGNYPSRHGARTLQDALPSDARTVAHLFGDSGYATAAVGKMHFVDESRRHGFAQRVNSATHLARLTRREARAFRADQGATGGTSGRPSAMPERLFRDTFYAEEAVRFLREHRDRPFCLWASFFMPHTPLVPHRKYWDLNEASVLQVKRPGREKRAPVAVEGAWRGVPGREEQAVHTRASAGRAGGSGCQRRSSRKRVSSRPAKRRMTATRASLWDLPLATRRW